MAGRVLPAVAGLATAAALVAPPPWRWLLGAAALAAGALYYRRTRREAAAAAETEGALRAEAGRLAERDRLHSALLEVLPVGVAALRDGRPVYANRAAAEVLGGRITEEGAPLPSEVREVIAAAGAGEFTAREFHRHPGRVIRAAAHSPGSDGLLVLTVTDVTERRRAETMNRDFVTAASHELKTPAAAIQAAAETALLAAEDDPEAVRDFTGRVLDNALRLSRIIAHLLDLSRLESGGFRPAPFDLADLCGEEAARLGSSGPSVTFVASPAPMTGSEADVALAVRNLLDNARRHTPEDGEVRVSVTAGDGEATVEVADTGSGIPAADLPRVFERFYRVDEARSRAMGGTGLGLAIVKYVADMHGGRVEAESDLGEGSVFRMRLPQVPPSP